MGLARRVNMRCKICNEWDWGDGHHKCPPVMYFKHEDWDDEWQEIRARDYEEAALKFAEIYNDCDYALMNHDTDVIIFDGEEEKAFTVSAEPSIDYHATEKEVLK